MGVKENKEIARRYHDLKPDDVDNVLTADYVGRHRTKPGGGFVHQWDRESHRKYLATYLGKQTDTIHQQIAEGDWVATWFTREALKDNGKRIRVDMMHFKRLAGGKIAEIWEYFDYKQIDEEL